MAMVEMVITVSLPGLGLLVLGLLLVLVWGGGLALNTLPKMIK
jgi:hypothetical protein